MSLRETNILRKTRHLIFILILLIPVMAQATEDAGMPVLGNAGKSAGSALEPGQRELLASLQSCFEEEMGISFLCSPQWAVHEEKGAVLLTINDDPAVVMAVVRVKEGMTSVYQLDQKSLDAVGQYQPGFALEDTAVAGRDAVKVKAFSKEYPEIRLVDYYVVNNKTLYGLFFSVNPKEEWGQYQFLFQKVVDSFEFL